MIVSARINDSLHAEIDLNFTTNTWSLPPAIAKWGGVMYSDRGLFEVMGWGAIWLMDGMGNGKKDCTIIRTTLPGAKRTLSMSPEPDGCSRRRPPRTKTVRSSGAFCGGRRLNWGLQSHPAL
jgi:hypothetical protein